MPFIVTTKRLTPDGLGVTRPNELRAVATLEEARTTVLDMDGCRWLSVSYLISESGGTVGPLPDGTLIEVGRVSNDQLWAITRAEFPGPLVPSEDEVLAAYNAKQAHAS